MTDCPTYGGWSITKSTTPFMHVDFKVISLFYRLTLFNFASLLDRYNKAVQPFPIICVFLFVSSLLDRYGKAVQLYFSFVNNKFNGRYLFRPVDCNSVLVIFRCNESSTPFQARRFKLCHRKLSAFFLQCQLK